MSARHHAASLVTPAISSPSLSARRLVRRQDAGDAATIHDGDAIGDVHDMFELGRNIEDADTCFLQIEDRVLHELDGADIEPLARLHDDEDARIEPRSRAPI